MRYKGKVYRPPSEAYSLIVQVTYGCSHNRCAFCDMYDDKHFAMRPMDEIREDFELARRVYRRVERVFLADGDALMRRTGDLVEILGLVYGLFPECQRVTCYASPTSLQIKSEDELRLLRSKGLQMVYMGLESGCDAVLEKMQKVKVSALYEYDGLRKVNVKEATIGAIVAVSGIADIHIGDTICSPDNPQAIPFQKISEPTIAMQFMVNDSPLAGQEGKFVTSRHLRDRLFKELNTDVSLRVEETESTECFKVSGRGELHLSVLIENMRREGYEFAVSKAEVLYHEDSKGRKTEPMEIAYIDVPDEFTGTVIEKLGQRKGELQNMTPITGGYTRLEFSIPARGLIGYRGEFMTDTKGNGIINTIFDEYAPYKGDIQYRKQGSLIAFESGESITYGLYNAQERGTLFIGAGEKVYAGMIIGQNGKPEDVEINVCKKKQLTNTRASGSDEALRLTPPKVLSLEQALEFIDTDELLEITPVSLRIRKKILDPTLRKRAGFNRNN